MGSLETLLLLGADLSLFDASELHVVLSRGPARMRRIRSAVRANLHVVFEDDVGAAALPEGMRKFVDHAEKGEYRQVQKGNGWCAMLAFHLHSLCCRSAWIWSPRF